MGDIKTLAEGLPEEQARVRDVLVMYKSIGTAGLFGATMIERSLQNADKAVMAGDIIEMLAAYNDLKEITG